jgi:hypothetical protein
MRRRLERDQGRLHGYYGGLRAEALARLAALPGNGDLTARQAAAAERERLRLDAIAREHQAKLNDLRRKFATTVTLQWSQTLELVMPVHRFEVVVKRRKRERPLTDARLEPAGARAGASAVRVQPHRRAAAPGVRRGAAPGSPDRACRLWRLRQAVLPCLPSAPMPQMRPPAGRAGVRAGGPLIRRRIIWQRVEAKQRGATT